MSSAEPLPSRVPVQTPLERLEAGIAAVARWSESRHIRMEIARRSGCALPPSELRLLEFFDLVEPLRISHVAECLQIDVSTVSIQLRQLRERHLVEAIPVEGDRRAVLIAITAEGRETVGRVRSARRDLLWTVFAETPDDQLEQVASLLLRVQEHMLDGLRAKLRAGGDAECLS
ncbi:transcriptional regulator [Frankia sp. EI5c]|uniref:MarR family winged helix-turn-helix transcriptional regulator n=1 Tax=Frankia sp. EI5c TaxID=683316 RepID=UPI0007C2FB71|nr:MarR family winged helix-turn-helix transcriptional regulator [Frankia sp. EI5c]OAA23649.1 transcriptional regulator [Frankia sp. EI5c]